MNKNIVKQKLYIKNNDIIEYSFVCENHFTKDDNKLILKKITSIKNKENIELIKEISEGMRKENKEEKIEKIFKDICKIINVGIDHHIIPRTLIRNWNITKGHDKTNRIIIRRKKGIKKDQGGYKKFMSMDYYFMNFNSKSITLLETGFISIFDDLLTILKNGNINTDFDIQSLGEAREKIKFLCFENGCSNYNKLLFYYFFHWAISHDKKKCKDFFKMIESNFSNYKNVDVLIENLLHNFGPNINKYLNLEKIDIFIFKVDINFNVEIPLGSLFSSNLVSKEKNNNFAISPLSPEHYLVIGGDIHTSISYLSNKTNLERSIKDYIILNLLDRYDKDFFHMACKSKIGISYVEYILDTKISALKNIPINFPFDYQEFTIRELIKNNIFDVEKVKKINIDYGDIL